MSPFKQPFVLPVAALHTPRLRIRIDTEEGYIDRFRTCGDPELMAWCGFSSAEELELQKRKISGGFSNYRTSTVFFHLIERGSETVIGSIAFHNWYQIHRRSEIGYAMSSGMHTNRGFMTEALPAVLEFGFAAMDLNRIEAFISPENMPSRRLVEQAGFRQEGQLREHYVHMGAVLDSVVYGLLRSDRQDR